MYGEGEIGVDRWAAVKAETSAALEALDEADVEVPVDVGDGDVDWEADPADIRAFLGTVWHEVRLDYVAGRLRPIEALWRVPQWRTGDD